MSNDGVTRKTGLFENLDGEQTITELESYCVNCGLNGQTKMLLTVIPHFREVIVMAFDCSYCGFKNNEIQSASTVQELAIRMKLTIKNKNELSRQVVKSDRCIVKFVELEVEIQPSSGNLTNVEGIIQKAIEEMSEKQAERAKHSVELFLKVEYILKRLKESLEVEESFCIEFDDLTGNSYVEGINGQNGDSNLIIENYKRSKEENVELCISQEQNNEDLISDQEDEISREDVHRFSGNCPGCNAICETHMHMIGLFLLIYRHSTL